ncbi:hypothetical protein HQ529_00175 [Candidatus Woesearchaeota archaeon]|nr:hypothetical protein [Candidatus Woesearchaeota archaeon]
MEFKIKKKVNPNIKLYKKEELDIAYEFSKRLYKEFGTFLKAVVLFGSTARRKSKTNDIDIMVVVDDITTYLGSDIVETYRIITEKIVADVSIRIHVTSIKFTSFWQYIRAADPIGINILRDGVALIDTGFFTPMQVLLFQGRIRPTYESIWTYFERAPRTLDNAKWHIMQATLDLYWAVIDSAHAALMRVGEIPPSPNHVAEMIDSKLVKENHIQRRYSTIMSDFYTLSKKITHREIKEVKGKDFDKYFKDAEEFVNEMKKFIKHG